jgi:hypothetical protein
MPNTKKPNELKELADEVLDSIDEAPKMEPGEADRTPAVPTQGTPNAANEERSPIVQKPKI